MMKTILVVDAGTIAYWKLFALVSKSQGYDTLTKNMFLMQESDDGFPNWCREVQNEIINFINLFDPDEVVIACDSPKLWRKHFYPEYKANRKAQRAEIPIDWNKFGNVRDEMFKLLPTILPVKSVFTEYAEADDIIAVITKEFSDKNEIIVITGDADIHQLFRFPNFRCYNPKERKEVTGVDWLDLLTVKILSGDRGDNIKPLRPRLGPATARKIINECEGDIHKYCEENDLLNQLTLNQKLVNFEMMPKKLYTMILEDYEKAIITVPNCSTLAMNCTLEYSDAMDLFNRKIFKQKDNCEDEFKLNKLYQNQGNKKNDKE